MRDVPVELETRLLPIPEALELLTGERVDASTAWRWYARGIDGVKLRTWKLGGKRRTNVAALRDFIAARTQQPIGGCVASKRKARHLDALTRKRLEQKLKVVV